MDLDEKKRRADLAFASGRGSAARVAAAKWHWSLKDSQWVAAGAAVLVRFYVRDPPLS
jgi:hypothetical protein